MKSTLRLGERKYELRQVFGERFYEWPFVSLQATLRPPSAHTLAPTRAPRLSVKTTQHPTRKPPDSAYAHSTMRIHSLIGFCALIACSAPPKCSASFINRLTQTIQRLHTSAAPFIKLLTKTRVEHQIHISTHQPTYIHSPRFIVPLTELHISTHQVS